MWSSSESHLPSTKRGGLVSTQCVRGCPIPTYSCIVEYKFHICQLLACLWILEVSLHTTLICFTVCYIDNVPTEPVTLTKDEALKREEALAKTSLPSPVQTAPHEIEARPKTHSFKPNFIKLYQPTRRGVVVLKSCHPHIIKRISRWEGRTRRQPYLRLDNMFNHPKYSHWTLQVKLK